MKKPIIVLVCGNVGLGWETIIKLRVVIQPGVQLMLITTLDYIT